MRKFLKWGGYALAGVILVGVVLIGLNFSNIQRLLRVNSLFDADKIVHNFSNMKDILAADELPISGTVHDWPVSLIPLNETYSDRGQEKSVSAMLEELQTTALVVAKDGVIVHEAYFKDTGADDLRISWSMSKSFVSALTGLALANGDIDSLDDPVTKYVPSLKNSAYDGVPLRDVMNMASGVTFDENYLDKKSDINKMGRALAVGGSLDDFAASIKGINRPSGTAWQYVSIDTHVISMVLRSATGQTLQDYFVENLWSKIGASADAYYSTDLQGNAFALGGLNMRTRDYALFGELFRNHGRRGDVQIIPEDWVAISTTNTAPLAAEGEGVPTQDGTPFGYGYQWWTPPHADGEYFAVGVYGQYIYVNPKAGITIAQNITLMRAMAEHYSDWSLPD